ncbi:hypothetical protein BKG63_10995 [Mycobacteroides chelonae]|nr:hypothetical protein BKG63_10995 [Mycobacteroides chelonae]
MHASADEFAAAIEFADHTYRSLADDVASLLRRDKGKIHMGCSHTTISNLAGGKARRVHPRRAAAIEKALKLPRGHLFRIEVFHVPTERRSA